MTPTQGRKYQELRQKLRMIVSHATGGHLHRAEDIDRSTNDICVEISKTRTAVWNQALENEAGEINA